MPAETNHTELFIEALNNVLESTAFIFTEDIPTEKFSINSGEYLAVDMTFHGPHRGRVTLMVQYPFCIEMAVNILGADKSEVNELMAGDALKEVLNMACGQFLTSMFGTVPVFDLSVPEIEKVKAAESAHLLSRSGSKALKADEWQLIANISMEDLN